MGLVQFSRLAAFRTINDNGNDKIDKKDGDDDDNDDDDNDNSQLTSD